jgi:superfamily II DNA or RNA helicase
MKNSNLLENITNWSDFVTTLEGYSKKEKGDAFELLTKLYFKLSPKYQFYEEVWLFSEIPSIELEKLGLPQQDLGIDLIVKNGNEYHAIQCKYHSDKDQSVTFKEVSTFISLLESNKKITQGYICSSADLTSRNFNKLKTKHINLILSDSWQELDEVFFSNAKSYLTSKKAVKLEPLSPRDHQIKAIKQAKEHFIKEKHNRGKLIFPCGAGKSLTGFWITQEFKSKSTIIAVPSLSLVKQTLEVYLREIVALNKRIKWLCICSDDGIGTNDDVVFYTENLGVPCQTDSEYIEHWLNENKNEEIIIFTTYQSGRLIADISRKLKFTFDVGIFDEAHKTVGSDKKLFSYLLFEENISIEKRIFMTATERFYSGSSEDIISMDNEAIYGDVFIQMSFKEAIESELLTDYKVITIDIRRSEIAEFIKENNLVQLNDKWKKETEARSLASMLALRKAMKQFPIKNAVSFHSSIEKAQRNKELQSYITESYHFEPIDTYTVSGKQPTTKRNAVVQEFAKSEKALITNARCLTEGVDVPNIDCIVFSDPRKSKVDIVQALGRALRKKKGKDWGYVILPVIYDETTHEIDNENFQEILAVVRGLASNDERIVEYFRTKSEKEEKVKRDQIKFNLEVFSDYIDEKELSDQLQIKLLEKLSRFNWMPFEEAREYVRSLKLGGWNEWQEYSKTPQKPINIPAHPIRVYKDKGWLSFGDWLGTDRIATGKREFRSFKEARSFARSLNLKNQKQWMQFTKENKLPIDIPTNPQRTYKNDGWNGWGDWIGTGKIATARVEYLPFNIAREMVHGFQLKNEDEWRIEIKKTNFPSNIPKTPIKVYADSGWLSWGDWLGTKKGFDKKYLSFEEARKFVHKLRLKRQKDWLEYCKSGKKPHNIPSSPHWTYKDTGWISFGDWLGTGYVSPRDRKYLPFVQARTFVRGLGLKNTKEWEEYCKSGLKPESIPFNADKTYKNEGWISYGDWIGTGYVSPRNRKYLPFEEAREFVRMLNLKGQQEFKKAIKEGKIPKNIPSNPNTVYANAGWTSFGDWLGTEVIANQNRTFLNFSEAKRFVHQLNLKSHSQWVNYCSSGKRPPNIPSAPDQKYKVDWNGWSDFLGKK